MSLTREALHVRKWGGIERLFALIGQLPEPYQVHSSIAYTRGERFANQLDIIERVVEYRAAITSDVDALSDEDRKGLMEELFNVRSLLEDHLGFLRHQVQQAKEAEEVIHDIMNEVRRSGHST